MGNYKKVDLHWAREKIRSGKTIKSIALELGISRVTLGYKLKNAGTPLRSVKFDERFFHVIISEAQAYWLGFIMADGCVSLTHSPKVVIKLKKEDRSHLEKWHESINSCLKVCDSGVGVQSQHYSKQMCQDLVFHGCTPRKSLSLVFPRITNELIPHFVRGYFDGDGCANMRKHQKKPQLRLSFVGTEDFLSQLQSIIGTSNKLGKAGRAKSLEVSGNIKAGNIAKWMYKDATIFLNRKMEICRAYL